MANNHGTHLFDEKAQKIFDEFVNFSQIKIFKVDVDMSWIKKMV